ncbi:putative protodermal factor 1 [Helianthus annuus]|nr:putative protodermal factor 1 [Helianthus annuus]
MNVYMKMVMDWVLTTLVLVAAAAIDGARGDTTVTGTVFCDQCKDGQFDTLDYPLGGVRILLACPGENGQYTVVREETTNWLGAYTASFPGTSDMGGCRAQVADDGQGCGAVVGPAQDFRLSLKMFDSQMYTVDPLVSQPDVPSPLCLSLATPFPSLPPITELLPMPPLPPLPPLPPMPTQPFFESSACPYQMWMMAQHRCYWMLDPELKVELVFGSLASTIYGPNITLRQSIIGIGDPYQTLLREGTTALLNAYTSTQFVYQPDDIVRRLNWALTDGTSQQLLMAALRFIKANSGQTGNTTCKFSVCT